MKLSVEPMECIVSYGTDEKCDLGRQTVTDGYFQEVLKKGLYHFKVEQSFYEPYVGVYRLDEQAVEQKIVLQPLFGYVKLNSDPEGAEVYVDDFTRPLGKTPLVSRKLTQGSHTLHIWKENYYREDVTVDVKPDGLEHELALVRLRPQYVNVTCLCEDAGADLTVLDAAGKLIASGKSGMKVPLNSHALYKLEATRPHHMSQSTGITLRIEDEGGAVNISVGSPLPIYGGLQITSTPTRADVYLDGVKVGTTTYIGKVLSGVHTLELRKEGYWMEPVVLDVKENQTLQRAITLKQGSPDGTLNISSHGSWVVRVAAKNGSYNERMYVPVYNLKLAPGTYTATIDGSSSNRELVKTFTVSSNKEVNLTMNPAKRVLNAHVIGFTYGSLLKAKQADGENSDGGNRGFLLGVSYTYLPSWIGPSVSLNYGFGGERNVQPAAGITLGFPSFGNAWGGYYLTTRYVYSTNYRNGFEIGVSFTKFFYISAVYFPAFKESELLISFSLPFPFR